MRAAPCNQIPPPLLLPDLWPWLWSWGCKAWSRGWFPGIGHCTAPSSGCLGGLWCLSLHHRIPSSQTCTCNRLAGECPGSELGDLWPPSTGLLRFHSGFLPFLPSACTPSHLQTPSSSCRAPCTGCAESGPRRYLRGNPRRSPCCWGCRAPRSTLRTRCPDCPSSVFLERTGNRAQDPGLGETRDSWRGSGPRNPGSQPEVAGLQPSFTPPNPVSPFFLATAEVSASRVRRARRRKPRCCILRGEPGSESPAKPFPTGGLRAWNAHPLSRFPVFQAQSAWLLSCGGGGGRTRGTGPSASRGVQPGSISREECKEPRTQLRPPPRRQAPGGQRPLRSPGAHLLAARAA